MVGTWVGRVEWLYGYLPEQYIYRRGIKYDRCIKVFAAAVHTSQGKKKDSARARLLSPSILLPFFFIFSLLLPFFFHPLSLFCSSNKSPSTTMDLNDNGSIFLLQWQFLSRNCSSVFSHDFSSHDFYNYDSIAKGSQATDFFWSPPLSVFGLASYASFSIFDSGMVTVKDKSTNFYRMQSWGWRSAQ